MLSSDFISLSCLINILRDVFLLEFSHSLDLIKVNYEASIVRVVESNTLSAKDSQVI